MVARQEACAYCGAPNPPTARRYCQTACFKAARAASAAARHADPDYKNRRNQHLRERSATEPEYASKRRERQAAYDARNPRRGPRRYSPEQRARWAAAYKAKNPDRVAEMRDAANARRRATKKGAPRSETVKRAAVWEKSGGVCHICGRAADPADWHQDHVFPLDQGGDHTLDNIEVAHPACNLQKRASLWFGPRAWPPATTLQ